MVMRQCFEMFIDNILDINPLVRSDACVKLDELLQMEHFEDHYCSKEYFLLCVIQSLCETAGSRLEEHAMLRRIFEFIQHDKTNSLCVLICRNHICPFRHLPMTRAMEGLWMFCLTNGLAKLTHDEIKKLLDRLPDVTRWLPVYQNELQLLFKTVGFDFPKKGEKGEKRHTETQYSRFLAVQNSFLLEE
jgi:hypothetical protein